jgi:hypothetical protein
MVVIWGCLGVLRPVRWLRNLSIGGFLTDLGCVRLGGWDAIFGAVQLEVGWCFARQRAELPVRADGVFDGQPDPLDWLHLYGQLLGAH